MSLTRGSQGSSVKWVMVGINYTSVYVNENEWPLVVCDLPCVIKVGCLQCGGTMEAVPIISNQNKY